MIYKKIVLYDFMKEFKESGKDVFSNKGYSELFKLLNNTVMYADLLGHVELSVGNIADMYIETDVDTACKDNFCNLDELKDETAVIELDNNKLIYRIF